MIQGTITIDFERCKGCNLCTLVCPKDVISLHQSTLNSNGYHAAILNDPDHACTGCAICAVICPDACITVFREPVRAERRASL